MSYGTEVAVYSEINKKHINRVRAECQFYTCWCTQPVGPFP